jgi:hypothetical protein
MIDDDALFSSGRSRVPTITGSDNRGFRTDKRLKTVYTVNRVYFLPTGRNKAITLPTGRNKAITKQLRVGSILMTLLNLATSRQHLSRWFPDISRIVLE